LGERLEARRLVENNNNAATENVSNGRVMSEEEKAVQDLFDQMRSNNGSDNFIRKSSIVDDNETPGNDGLTPGDI
jgi:hypothetical protein